MPGIDFTNDPLLQARNFSYLDTQLIRLGGPNFAQLPVNRPVAEVHHNQRDGYGQHRIDRGQTSYFPNSLAGGCPVLASVEEGAYAHFAERVEGHRCGSAARASRTTTASRRCSGTAWPAGRRQHIVAAFSFELGKVDYAHVQERVVGHLNLIDHELATQVAANLGLRPPGNDVTNHGRSSPALSQADQPRSTSTRKVAVLAADGVDVATLRPVLDRLVDGGAICEVLAPHGGELATGDGGGLLVDRSLVTTSSVLYDAVLVAGGDASVGALLDTGDAVHFPAEAYKHVKPVAALGAGVRLLERAALPGARLATADEGVVADRGVVTLASGAPSGTDLDGFAAAFEDAIRAHRHFGREVGSVPA